MEDERTFLDVFAVVKYKIANKEDITTEKEQFIQDVIMDWCSMFGIESLDQPSLNRR